MAERAESPSILDKLDEIVPAPLEKFDAFPKLPSTYKSRSESRGFLTLFVAFLASVLVLNDLGEYIWGWPDYEFSIDSDTANDMNVNVDIIVNMPCQRECLIWLFSKLDSAHIMGWPSISNIEGWAINLLRSFRSIISTLGV